MTASGNGKRRSDGAVSNGTALLISTCPDPDCTAPAEVYSETEHYSTDGPVPHARTRCLNRHSFQLPVEYIPGMPLTRRPSLKGHRLKNGLA
jgi:hypothetical protein